MKCCHLTSQPSPILETNPDVHQEMMQLVPLRKNFHLCPPPRNPKVLPLVPFPFSNSRLYAISLYPCKVLSYEYFQKTFERVNWMVLVNSRSPFRIPSIQENCATRSHIAKNTLTLSTSYPWNVCAWLNTPLKNTENLVVGNSLTKLSPDSSSILSLVDQEGCARDALALSVQFFFILFCLLNAHFPYYFSFLPSRLIVSTDGS